LLFGYGETHDRRSPKSDHRLVHDHLVRSADAPSDIISFTHDIRAPEIERELSKRGVKPTALRIDSAYNMGGFKLMRKVIEDATGLSIDFQVTFRDAAIQRLVDNVFDGIQVTAPMAFDVHPFISTT